MANQKSLVSIIIPAYNIDEYLSACLDSALSQDFSNYEIVVIDDGSTDNTPKISDEYAKKYENVITIHQKNSGLSSARNTGIKRAKGEYVALIDGDDIIAPNFLARLYQAVTKTNSDIAICNFQEFSDTIPAVSAPSKISVESRNEAVKKLLIQQENRDIIACNKLYKKEIFKNIEFPVGQLHEDTLTTYKLLAAANRVANIDDALYFYRKREGSIMAEQDLKKRLEIKERAANEAIAYFENNPELKLAAEVALLLSKFAYLDNIASGKIHDQKLWQGTIKEINSSRKNYKTNPYLTKKLKLYLVLLKMPLVYKTFRKIIHE
ncbi:glycosyltransferase [Candidatus Saccharibacteria bacterium]|nr:glycosyltransferase [Candidatus Saccharibacteria bacterium]